MQSMAIGQRLHHKAQEQVTLRLEEKITSMTETMYQQQGEVEAVRAEIEILKKGLVHLHRYVLIYL